METGDILKALTTLEEGHFPRAALEAAIAQREAITPHLLRVLEEVKQDELERMFAEPDYMLPFYALYLLAQFRETRAYPLIVDIFAIPGEDVHDAFGDLITEDLNRILASVSGGDVTGLHRLIEGPQVDEYVRAAAMEALVVMVVQDVLTRATRSPRSKKSALTHTTLRPFAPAFTTSNIERSFAPASSPKRPGLYVL